MTLDMPDPERMEQIRRDSGYAPVFSGDFTLNDADWHGLLGCGCGMRLGKLYDSEDQCYGCAAHSDQACELGCWRRGFDGVHQLDLLQVVNDLVYVPRRGGWPPCWGELRLLRLTHHVTGMHRRSGGPARVHGLRGHLVLARISAEHPWMAEMYSMRDAYMVPVDPQVLDLSTIRRSTDTPEAR